MGSYLGASLGLAAAGTAARPDIANAAATTVIACRKQGFCPAEDAPFKTLVADWEEASGNKFGLLLVPFQALNETIVSAPTSDDLPDPLYADSAPSQIGPPSAWDGKLGGVSDMVKTQRNNWRGSPPFRAEQGRLPSRSLPDGDGTTASRRRYH